MKWLLSKWNPSKKLGKIIHSILSYIYNLICLGFVVVSFLNKLPCANILQYVWCVCAIAAFEDLCLLNGNYKDKLTTLSITIFTLFLSIGLHNYWNLLSVPAVVCFNIVIALLELAILICCYKHVHLIEKNRPIKLKVITPKFIWTVVTYLCALDLFVYGLLKSLAVMYVFGIIAVILLCCSIVLMLSDGSLFKKNRLYTISFVLDTITMLALIVYMIYAIPSEYAGLQNIILTLTAAIIGGILTLCGVAWTIRNTQNEKKEEERKKHIPYIKLTHDSPTIPVIELYDNNTIFELENEIALGNVANNTYYTTCFEDLTIKNISESSIQIVNIQIADVQFKVKNNIIEKNSCASVSINRMHSAKSPVFKNITITINDILGNSYSLKCGLEQTHSPSCTDPNFPNITRCKNDVSYRNQYVCYKITSIDLPKLLSKEIPQND